MIKKRWIYIFLLIIILGFLFTFLSIISSSQRELSLYEIDSYNQYGFKALMLFLMNAGFQVQVEQDFNPVSDSLIIISPATKLNEEQIGQVLNWVKNGGEVLELVRLYPTVLQSLKTGSITYVEQRNDEQLHAFKAIAEVEWLASLEYHIQTNPIYTEENPGFGFLKVNNSFFAYQNVYGKGKITYWNDANGLLNKNLVEHPDNAVVFALLLKNISKSKVIKIYLPKGNAVNKKPQINNSLNLWVAGLVLFSVLVLVLWKVMTRFGRPRPLDLAKGRSADEFVYSMALLFNQSNAKNFVIENMKNNLIEMVSELTKTLENVDLEKLLQQLTYLTGRKELSKKIKLVLDKINELGEGEGETKISRRCFLKLTVEIDSCRKELEEWKRQNT